MTETLLSTLIEKTREAVKSFGHKQLIYHIILFNKAINLILPLLFP